MVKITFIDNDETPHVVEASAGQSMMQAALYNGVESIVGECGGACACGTCRVYVDPAWQALTGQAPEMEREMLEFSGEHRADARLCCQISLTEAMDGLVVRTPASQY